MRSSAAGRRPWVDAPGMELRRVEEDRQDRDPVLCGRQDVSVVVAEVVLAGSPLDLRPIEGLTEQADPE